MGYDKTLAPPDERQCLTTPEGLRYWEAKEGGRRGLFSSVLTEDPSISMHIYSIGEREDFYFAYLFRYRGTAMGFLRKRVDGGRPHWDSNPEPDVLDEATNTLVMPVCFIGTPVCDEAAGYERGPDGEFVRMTNRGDLTSHDGYRLKPRHARTGYYVTGLGWGDYDSGKRDRFPSWQVQSEMLALWPFLFEGLNGAFRPLRPGWTGRAENGKLIPAPRMVFGKRLQEELTAGLWLDADRRPT